MKIGILGTRGIPNAYGGFEQCAQHLALGLSRKGHAVYVYNSTDHPYKKSDWKGINIIHCKDWESRIGTAGQFIYDYNCLKDARKRRFDILLQLGYTSNSLWYRLWPKDTINIVNMDGLEWKRSKYNWPTQRFLKKAEQWAALRGDILIADSLGIQDYLRKEYQKDSIYIAYGAEIFQDPDPSVLSEWNLSPIEYFLVVARMEPENNAEMIIQGFLQSKRRHPLILVGSTHNSYGKYLTSKYKSSEVQFPGAIYTAKKINNLRYYSRLYFHGHSVGGTNPSLLEAMACSCTIAAHENAFNKAILTDNAFYFSRAENIRNIINLPVDNAIIHHRKEINLEKIKILYNWDRIVDEYEKVFLSSRELLKKRNNS